MRFAGFDFVPVSITFDDGNKCQHEDFFPVMKEHGVRGPFYVTVDTLGLRNQMSLSDLKEIYKAGNEIASHTCTHPHLPGLSEIELDRELKKSKDFLEPFGCKSLTYPYGKYNDRVIDYAKRYYAAARGYYDPSKQSRDCGYNYGGQMRLTG